jgi:3-amino-5-hydroxybenzoate synthase
LKASYFKEAMMSTKEFAAEDVRDADPLTFPAWPVADEREVSAVRAVMESGQWWRMVGSQVVEFEKEFAARHAAARALAVTNGTHAIELALAALGIGRGDEVIIPAFTFISTASAVLCAQAVPVLVDVDPDTYCLDPARLEDAITPRTRAVIPVHMAGHIADMDAILEITGRHDLRVIEDAAHAQGAMWKGAHVGALDAGGIYSFQAGKLMTAGEGGLVMSNDADFIENCFLYGNCGRPKTDRAYRHSVLGTNCRMTELQAAVLRVQLTRLDEQNRRREANAAALDRMFADEPGIVPQGRDPRVTVNPHYMYMFRYDPSAFGGLPRRQFVDALIEQGVPAFVGYAAIHRTPVFSEGNFGPRWRAGDELLPDYNAVSCPVAEALGDEVVWLHHRVLLGDDSHLAGLAEAVGRVRRRAPSLVGVS